MYIESTRPPFSRIYLQKICIIRVDFNLNFFQQMSRPIYTLINPQHIDLQTWDFFYINPGVQQDRIPPFSYCYPAVFLFL